MTHEIDYAHLMHDAMRGLIRNVLEDVAQNGLPGAHHFFITFDTGHPDAELADWLSDQYPQEMTVVLQNWYDGLEINDSGFAVTLNFGNAPETLFIPFEAIRTFVDPSVEFGLRFEAQGGDDMFSGEMGPVLMPVGESASDDDPPPDPDPEPKEPGNPTSQVVSLDSFRK